MQTPSDIRIRDYGLGEVLFKSFGSNAHIMQGKWWGEINSIKDLRIDLCLKSDISDSYDFFMVILGRMFLKI